MSIKVNEAILVGASRLQEHQQKMIAKHAGGEACVSFCGQSQGATGNNDEAGTWKATTSNLHLSRWGRRQPSIVLR